MQNRSFMRRRQKLVKGLQMRLVLTFLSIAVLASLFQVFLLNRSLLNMAAEMPTSGDDVLGSLQPMLTQNLLFSLLVLVPTMLFIGVHVTHRVAGPIVRFERWLDDISLGNEVGPCRIRKRDELQELCVSLNRAFERMQQETAESPAREEQAVAS